MIGGIPAVDAGRAAAAYSKVMEISTSNDDGKRRIRRAFDTLMKDIINPRGTLPQTLINPHHVCD